MFKHFHNFNTLISEIELPKKFTYPFYYEPHPLCEIATREVQEYLESQTDLEHNFGLDPTKKGMVIGKMFGVLVVQNTKKELGYLAAFSGRLADQNTHNHFVPPVYDILSPNSDYLKGKQELTALDKAINNIEQNAEFIVLKKQDDVDSQRAALDIQEKKEAMIASKKDRRLRRAKAKTELSEGAYATLLEELGKESLEAKGFFNNVNRYWQHTLKPIKDKVLVFTEQIAVLKEQRKTKSLNLQRYISEQYHFLNSKKESKNLGDLFEVTSVQNIPAGTGDCAAPKLLQYAFLNDLKPIAIAEFWWGKSPNKEVRKHQQFYPACQGKCKPILTHMLEGIEMDSNPLLQNPAIGKTLEIVFEDDHLLVVNKPADFLSVPGIHIHDSVFTRIKDQVKNITGPIIIHRLDMATSGLLVLAKNKKVHKHLQSQFIDRSVKKRYTAILDGITTEDSGTIDLPLHLDFYDRPRQMVCYDFGKPAVTKWKVIQRKDGNTKVHFYPVTGRTHQLRVHASHTLGMNTPIVGDDLYGKKSDRLYLHADTLEFVHPLSEERMTFYVDPKF